MKTTTFDQLKSMLKSASYSIFTRIGRAEKNVQSLTDQVSNLKNQIPAKPKKIIFRQNSSDEYTCDLTFDDLWAMEPEIIASNTILIDRYGIEKAARSARKGCNVEYGIRNIQIDIDGNFESDFATYFKPTLIIDWWANAVAATINVHTASSLSNKTSIANGGPNVPVLQYGNWENCEVGDGLEVVGGKLRVVSDGVWELIEETILTESVESFSRNEEPDGTPYNYKAVVVRADFANVIVDYSASAYGFRANSHDIYCYKASRKVENVHSIWGCVDNSGYAPIINCCIAANGGASMVDAFTGLINTTYNNTNFQTKLIESIILQGVLPEGVKISIWGVRA